MKEIKGKYVYEVNGVQFEDYDEAYDYFHLGQKQDALRLLMNSYNLDIPNEFSDIFDFIIEHGGLIGDICRYPQTAMETVKKFLDESKSKLVDD